MAKIVPESLRCYKCREEKPLDAFGASSRTWHGRKTICKQCRSLHQPTPELPKDDQIIDGAHIYWSDCVAGKTASGRNVIFVRVACALCGQERQVNGAALLHGLRYRPDKFTGRCRSCAPLKKRTKALDKYYQLGHEQVRGATIQWDRTKAPLRSGRAFTVPVLCRCGKERWVQVPAARSKPLCASCAVAEAIAGDKNPRWKGGHLTGNGYRMIRIPPDHRLRTELLLFQSSELDLL